VAGGGEFCADPDADGTGSGYANLDRYATSPRADEGRGPRRPMSGILARGAVKAVPESCSAYNPYGQTLRRMIPQKYRFLPMASILHCANDRFINLDYRCKCNDRAMRINPLWGREKQEEIQ
jgi:hypothetical protein